MFVSGGMPWDVTAAPPILPPLGGLLSMLESGKDGGGGLRAAPLMIPPTVPRTAACVVLSQPHNLSPPSVPSTTLAQYTKSSSPSTPPPPPLKFGVDRLLAVDPPKEVPTVLSHPSNPIFTSPSATASLTCPVLPLTSGTLGATTCPVITTATTTIHSNGYCPSFSSTVNCPVISSSCGCDVAGGKCPSECGYYYTPSLYATHPAQLLPYASLYGSTMGSHRPEVMGVGVATGSHHGRRKRTWTRAVFSNLQRKGLEKRFQLQKYITKPDRRQLAATLGLTDAQVKVWFQNRRMKWRHAELKKREQQQLQQQKQQDRSTPEQQEQQQQQQTDVCSPEKSESNEHIQYLVEPDDDDDDDDDDEEEDEEIDPVDGCLQDGCMQTEIGII